MQAIENGVFEPLRGAGLRARSDATVEDGDQQVGADGRSVALFGNVPGGLRDAGVGREGGDGAEVTHQGFDGIAGHDGDDSVGRTEILLPDDGGLSVDALGLARVVVSLSADVFFDEADHFPDPVLEGVRSYITRDLACVNQQDFDIFFSAIMSTVGCNTAVTFLGHTISKGSRHAS